LIFSELHCINSSRNQVHCGRGNQDINKWIEHQIEESPFLKLKVRKE